MSGNGRGKLVEEYPHLKDFFPYLDVLNTESGRGKVLVSCSFLEQQLEAILRAFMRENESSHDLVDGPNAPLGTFYTLTAACHALGLIDDKEARDINLLRKIRNDFAHDLHTTFDTPAVKNRCRELRYKAHDYTREDGTELIVSSEGQFTTCATGLIMSLTNRAHYVRRERRVEKEWPT